MSQPRHDPTGPARTDDDMEAVHGLVYALPLSLFLWAVILCWLFLRH